MCIRELISELQVAGIATNRLRTLDARTLYVESGYGCRTVILLDRFKPNETAVMLFRENNQFGYDNIDQSDIEEYISRILNNIFRVEIEKAKVELFGGKNGGSAL